MATTTTPAAPRASFGTTKKKIAGVTARARLMYAAILAAVATFQTPPVTMVIFLGLIQALEVAQLAAATKAKGLASARNSRRDTLWTAMETLLVYVQGIANTVSVTDAITVIESAGLLVAKARVQAKALLQAKLTTTPGTVHLVANATLLRGNTKKHVVYSWAWSLDGKSWTLVPSTPYARTDIANLTLLTTYWFRVSATVGTAVGEWSQPVSVLVH
jgi:hypothetical protein